MLIVNSLFTFIITDPTAGVKKGHSLPFPPSENAPVVQGPTSPKPQQESKPIETNKHIASSAKSCSHCSIPTTTTKAPQLTDIAVVSRDRPVPSAFGQQESNYQQQGFSSQPNYPSQESGITNEYGKSDANPNIPQQGNYDNQNYPQNVREQGAQSQSSPPSKNSANEYYPQELPKQTEQEIPNVSQNYPQLHSDNNYVPQASYNQPQPEEHQPTQGGTLRNPKQYTDITPNYGNNQPQGFDAALASQNNPPVSNKPTLVAAQMQIVSKDTDIYHKNPGEREGLPNGISKNDMTRLLYTFNYTVGFHGHHEEGYTNGAKQGYYYTTGRNGVRIRVDYVADENGFRPKISQEVLDVLSDDVPKPETEKEERFGLKGYEFKWLYYPTDGKKK